MMALEESCNLFQINNLDEIDEKSLRKKYHKMCLKYHPDKNKNHENRFSKIKECYDILDKHIKDKNTCQYEASNNISQHTESVFETIISLISIENIEYILKLIDSYKIYMTKEPDIITLNVSLQQIYDKCVYVMNNGHYIPLWHSVIHQFSVKEQKHIIYIIKVHSLPQNISISKNNDISVKVLKQSVIQEEINTIHICENIYVDTFISAKEYYDSVVIIKNKGIPKTNMKDIYNCSQISNIYLYLV